MSLDKTKATLKCCSELLDYIAFDCAALRAESSIVSLKQLTLALPMRKVDHLGSGWSDRGTSCHHRTRARGTLRRADIGRPTADRPDGDSSDRWTLEARLRGSVLWPRTSRRPARRHRTHRHPRCFDSSPQTPGLRRPTTTTWLTKPLGESKSKETPISMKGTPSVPQRSKNFQARP